MTAVPAPSRLREAGRPRAARRRVHRTTATGLVLVDAVAALVALGVPLAIGAINRGSEALLFVPAWVWAVALVGEYRLPGDLALRARRLTVAALGLPTAMLLLADTVGYPLSAGGLVPVCCGTLAASCFGRFVGKVVAQHGLRVFGLTHRVVVAGPAAAIPRLVADLGHPLSRFEVVGVCLTSTAPVGPDWDLPVVSGLDSCGEEVAALGADGVVLVPDHTVDPTEVRRLRWRMEELGAKVLVAPGLIGVSPGFTSIDIANGVALVHVDTARGSGRSRLAKAVLERVAAVLALLLASPLLAVLALLVRLDSPGPAFFSQVRVGKDDSRFRIWKLRTMAVDAEQRLAALAADHDGAGPLFKLHDDPRVTRIGRFLRATSLDELPQLFNVVLGQMSLVGPRPALPSEVERYEPDVRRRLVVRPGITGLWQVSGRSDLSWEESVRLDQHYVDNWSLGLDLVILLRTAVVVLRSKGAY